VALALSGCGAPSAGAAAVVDGHRISIAELQTTTVEIAPLVSDTNPRGILTWLILAPAVIDVASKNHVGVSDDQARKDYAAAGGKKAGSALSADTVLWVRGQDALNAMKKGMDQTAFDAAVKEILAQVQSQKIQVNPRYGAFDSVNLTITSKANPWLVETASAQIPVGQ
jgi:hypothetical protein